MSCLGGVGDVTVPPSTRQAPHDLRPQVGKSTTRSSSFANVPRAAGHSRCEVTRAPEPLATPDPLMEDLEIQKVTISFIVGTDGRVHSAFILQSGGFREDRAILETVRSWRYRPALCNGVPTEAEARIQFSNR
jgi:TonB family protein